MMDLSICIIAKNEEERIRGCLESIREAADEIIVVDTGSQDDTVRIARKTGAKVIESEWRDDFSYSRNISIREASGKWILWLDADDIIPPESAALIKQLKKDLPDKAYAFIVRNEKPGNIGSEFYQARMFPKRDDILFEGRIHEQFMPSALRAGLKMEKKPVVIEHHGYADPDQLKKKAQRNIRLLKEMLNEKPPDPVSCIEIADSYTILEDWESAEEWYRRVVSFEGCEKNEPVILSQAYMGLGNILNKRKEYSKAADFFRKALELAPRRADALYHLGVALHLDGKIAQAVESLKKVLSLENSPVKVSVDFRQARIKACLRLGIIFRQEKMYDELGKHVERALADFGERPEVLNMAGLSYYVMGRMVEALRFFERSLKTALDGNIDAYTGLCMIYKKVGREELVKNTLKDLKGPFGKMAKYRALLRVLDPDGSLSGGLPLNKCCDEREIEMHVQKIKDEYGV